MWKRLFESAPCCANTGKEKVIRKEFKKAAKMTGVKMKRLQERKR